MSDIIPIIAIAIVVAVVAAISNALQELRRGQLRGAIAAVVLVIGVSWPCSSDFGGGVLLDALPLVVVAAA